MSWNETHVLIMSKLRPSNYNQLLSCAAHIPHSLTKRRKYIGFLIHLCRNSRLTVTSCIRWSIRSYEFKNLECSDCDFNWKLRNRFDPHTLPINRSYYVLIDVEFRQPHGVHSSRRNPLGVFCAESCGRVPMVNVNMLDSPSLGWYGLGPQWQGQHDLLWQILRRIVCSTKKRRISYLLQVIPLPVSSEIGQKKKVV